MATKRKISDPITKEIAERMYFLKQEQGLSNDQIKETIKNEFGNNYDYCNNMIRVYSNHKFDEAADIYKQKYIDFTKNNRIKTLEQIIKKVRLENEFGKENTQKIKRTTISYLENHTISGTKYPDLVAAFSVNVLRQEGIPVTRSQIIKLFSSYNVSSNSLKNAYQKHVPTEQKTIITPEMCITWYSKQLELPNEKVEEAYRYYLDHIDLLKYYSSSVATLVSLHNSLGISYKELSETSGLTITAIRVAKNNFFESLKTKEQKLESLVDTSLDSKLKIKDRGDTIETS